MIHIFKNCRRHVFLMVVVLLFVLTAGCGSDSSGPSPQANLPIVIISDVHFTPFYDTGIFNDLVNSPVEQWAAIFQSSSMTDLSSWGHETNYPLLKRVLDAAGQAAGHVPVERAVADR